VVMMVVLDGGQPAEAGLSASSVVGPFDPGDDRDPQLLSGSPAVAVEDVLLQQGEERFHGGVVTSGTDLAHGSDQLVTAELSEELS
jgi:hypothetical protein